MKEFKLDLDFILNMFISKFNLVDQTFSYTKVSDFLETLRSCLQYIFDKTLDLEARHNLIQKFCTSFVDNNMVSDWKWKMLDLVLSLQQDLQTNRLVIPIIYEPEPEGSYWVGKYFGKKRCKYPLRYDVVENKTFVFDSSLTKVEENKRVVEIYKNIKNNNHSYFSYNGEEFVLPQEIPYRSNLVFHIYCDVKFSQK